MISVEAALDQMVAGGQNARKRWVNRANPFVALNNVIVLRVEL